MQIMEGDLVTMTDREYYELVSPYEDAMNMLQTRIQVLGHSLYAQKEEQLYHNIQYRIKTKESIENKLVKRGLEPTVGNAKDCLRDIAGIRIICYFLEDIYTLIDLLTKQSDLIFVREKDYIKNPKENGYRSYHLIVGVPVYCSDATEIFPVELQIRTIEMDLWASMEHKILYKGRSDAHREQIRQELLDCSRTLCELENYFEAYAGNIDHCDTGTDLQ